MKVRYELLFAAVAVMLAAGTPLVFSQDAAIKTQPSDNVPMGLEPDMPWVWAEVVVVDRANNTMTIKYLDYETDTEKEMVMGVDGQTAFDNAKSLDDVKPQDTVSIDYVVDADGRNTARNVNVERPEAMAIVDDSAALPPPDALKAEAEAENQEAGQ
jgi:hypothetical protein